MTNIFHPPAGVPTLDSNLIASRKPIYSKRKSQANVASGLMNSPAQPSSARNTQSHIKIGAELHRIGYARGVNQDLRTVSQERTPSLNQ